MVGFRNISLLFVLVAILGCYKKKESFVEKIVVPEEEVTKDQKRKEIWERIENLNREMEEEIGKEKSVDLPSNEAVLIDYPTVEVKNELYEASIREKIRRRHTRPPVLVITDKNLSELAKGGKLTYAKDLGEGGFYSSAKKIKGDRERYYRRRVVELRLAWREAVRKVKKLEEEIAYLRRRFYEEDDPYVRDRNIKPLWDSALDKLEAARKEAYNREMELKRFIEKARKEGALPGWLREGKHLEPEDRPYGEGGSAPKKELIIEVPSKDDYAREPE